MRRQSCSECGELLREETIPALIATQSCKLNQTSIRLPLRGTMQLSATVLPENATNRSVSWVSSDETIATVDESGLVTALGKGTAAIYCKTVDTLASAACEVTVYQTTGQWLTRYLLFGWIWQK